MSISKTLAAASSTILSNVDYSSSVRHGNIERLHIGEVPYVNIKDPVLVSTQDGSMVTNGLSVGTIGIDSNVEMSRRAHIECFEIQKKFSIKWSDFKYRKNIPFDEMGKQFAKHEVNEVLRRMNNAEDLVYAKPSEIANLKKLFNGLDRKVAVLPSGKVVDLGKNFTLWIRKDIEVISANNPDKWCIDIIMYEIVGFHCEL